MKFIDGKEVRTKNKEEFAVYQEVQSNLETPKMWKLFKKYLNKKTSINLLVKIL